MYIKSQYTNISYTGLILLSMTLNIIIYFYLFSYNSTTTKH